MPNAILSATQCSARQLLHFDRNRSLSDVSHPFTNADTAGELIFLEDLPHHEGKHPTSPCEIYT